MLAVGDKAPDFVLPQLLGDDVVLAEIARTGPVLIAFFKGSCPVCQYTFPFLERLTAAEGLKVIGISQDDRKATEAFRSDYALSFPLALDSARPKYPVSNAYKISHVPSLFLIESGEITHAVSGFSRGDLEAIGRRFGMAIFRPGEKTPDFRPG